MAITSLNNNILTATLFGKSRRAVLSLLYNRADESFYLRQIASITGIGLGPIQRELKNLTDTGIIIREVRGKQVYFRANVQCPIYNELKGIVRKTFGVADVIRESLAPISKKIEVAFIFGSVAQIADTRASDIDVMIIGEVSFSSVSSAISQAEKLIQREINPVVYPPAEFKQKVKEDHHFVKTVLEDEKIFLVGNEGELQKLKASASSIQTYSFPVSKAKLAEFCRRHHIKKLSLFGSVLREDFRPDSDIDMLVEFEPGHVPGLFGLADMETELSALLDGHKVDLRTPADLSRYFRDRVLREAEVQYATTR